MSGPRRLLIPVALVLVIVAVVVLLPNGNRGDQVSASGTVEATDADLGFQASGRIEVIYSREGDRVDSGAQLATLDQAELMARRSAARAQVEAARAMLTELERGFRSEEIQQGRARVRAATQQVVEAERDLARARRLYEGDAVSRERLEDQETRLELAEADLEQAREQLAILESGPRRERIDAQRAQVQQAEAQVAQIDAALKNSTVTAPFAGIITVRHREPGEAVTAGAPVLTLMNPEDRWVRIYVREDEAGRVSLGQRARITADSYPDRVYQGEVVFIASEAEFTPRNVQTTEERVKLVYEVKVRITEDPTFDLKPGLAADVDLLETDS